MGNTPNMSVDPDGGWSWVGAGVGAVAGIGLSYARGDQDNWYLYAAGGFVAGGIVGELAHSGHDIYDRGANSWDKFTSIFGEGEITKGSSTLYSRFNPSGMGKMPKGVAEGVANTLFPPSKKAIIPDGILKRLSSESGVSLIRESAQIKLKSQMVKRIKEYKTEQFNPFDWDIDAETQSYMRSPAKGILNAGVQAVAQTIYNTYKSYSRLMTISQIYMVGQSRLNPNQFLIAIKQAAIKKGIPSSIFLPQVFKGTNTKLSYGIAGYAK